MDYKQAAREWSQGTVRSLYVLHGAETYIMSEWLELLTSKWVSPETKDFALSRYDLHETPLEAVIEDAETPPFLAERKVVIAAGAQFLTGGRDTSRAEHRVEALSAYAERPAEHAVVVLTVSAEKLDERKKVVKQLKQQAAVLSFQALGPAELHQWLTKKAGAWNVRLEEQAAELLLRRVGGSCGTLASEIEKLALYVGRGNTVDERAVEALTVRTTEQNVFQLVEEIARLQPDRALTILHDLLKEKEEPIKLLMLIARQFRMMLGAKELSRQGFSNTQMASQLGAHPYAVKLAAEQAKRYKPETLERIMADLAELDVGMKTGAVDKVFGLELFILRLGAKAAGTAG